MTSYDEPSLYYFNAAGRAECIRLTFRIGGIKFEDNRFNPVAYLWTHRSKSPTGRVPYMLVEGKMYTESWALLQYAAVRAGIAPSEPLDQLRVEMLTYYADNIINALHPIMFPSWNKAKLVKEVSAKISEDLQLWDRLVQETIDNGYAVGGKVSTADVMIYCIYGAMARKQFGVNIERLEQFHCLRQIHDTVSKLPQLQEPTK